MNVSERLAKAQRPRVRLAPYAPLFIGVLLVVSLGLGLLRFKSLDYDFTFMIPEKVYNVNVVQTAEGHGDNVRLRAFLPVSNERQRVLSEQSRPGVFEFTTESAPGGRLGVWTASDLADTATASFRYRIAAQAVRYEVSPDFRMGETNIPASLSDYLQPTKVVQSEAPEVLELAQKLRPASGSTLDFLQATFDHIQGFGFKPFKGTTDALTALRLGEASCNGRSRLFVALLRSEGIPARLVGGLVLTAGRKRTSHQWLEAYIGGHWVPFDPTNNHFAFMPANYISLYQGDHVLFRRTADIGYDFFFRIDPDLVPRLELDENRSALGLWSVFTRLGIPLDILKVIIMIPLGATVVVLFRNVVGLRTFGTFLPALIAAAATSTGFLWGALGFAAIVFVVSLLRRGLGRLELLHSPQLAVMLTVVIALLLGIAMSAAQFGWTDFGRLSLFPVAILAITAERFTLVEEEEGSRVAWTTMLRTLVVIYFCHLTMSSLSLQILMLGFPELLLAIIALDIWLGRWMGLRLAEWLRFAPVLTKQPEPKVA